MAPKVSAEFIFGGGLVAVWGVEIVKSIFGLMVAPHESILESGAMLEYHEYVNFWIAVRCVLSVIGVVAGLLVMRHRRAGHWLALLSGAFLLCFAVDLHWYKHLVPGPENLLPLFFLTAPGLGYAVIVFPVIVACFVIASAVILLKGRRRNESIRAGAI